MNTARLMSERQLQRHVEDAARTLGWLTFHTFLSVRSAPGFPDIVAVRGDRCLVIELKRAGASVTPAQLYWLVAFEQVPCIECHVWRPEDWFSGRIEETLR